MASTTTVKAVRHCQQLAQHGITPPKTIPDNHPAPEDDGAAAHPPGLTVPNMVLEATDGQQVDLSKLGGARSIIYLYPLTGLPFSMHSDTGFKLAEALSLPTFAAPGHPRLYSRLTLVVSDRVIEHGFYPIFPPTTHAQQVLAWLEANPAAESDVAGPTLEALR